MPFVDVSSLSVVERLLGWFGRYFHSASMTFAHYDFRRGSSIHEHFHAQEKVYEVVEGELEVTIEWEVEIAGWGGGDCAEQCTALGQGAQRWSGDNRGLSAEAGVVK
jgi:hypothetical protein